MEGTADGREIVSCDVILSLGTNCEISYNLRAFYGAGPAGLLDWMITPLSALPGLIESGFCLVGPDFADELECVALGGGDSIMHRPTGILLHHAFPRDADERVVANWRDSVPQVISKYGFLGARMHRLLEGAEKPGLFLNRSGLHDAMSAAVRSETESSIIYARIFDALSARYPHADIHPVIINGAEEAVARAAPVPNLRVCVTENLGHWHEGIEGHFAGCATGWNRALSSLGLVRRFQPEEAPQGAPVAGRVPAENGSPSPA